jgi:hypothetical protein
MNTYTELLSKITAATQTSHPHPASSHYNIFHILDISNKEVIMCRFLADLLNPEGCHGCGILFLKSFFHDILNESGLSDALLTHTDVVKEYVIDHERRIDIVIKNARFFIPIEVKLYGGEQEGQCYDYFRHAIHSPIIYLTRFGDIPSPYSRKEKGGTELLSLDHILCISWKYDICGWLERMTGHLTEPVKSIVVQYTDAIRRMTDLKEKESMEKTLDILYGSPDYFRAGIEIEKSMKAAKIGLIRLVFDDFKKEMLHLLPKYGLEMETECVYYSYEEKQHDKFYDCYSTYPGLNYVVKQATFQKQSLTMWFRIEVEHNLFAGITLFDREAITDHEPAKGWQVDDITRELIDEAARYLCRDIITPNPKDWWLTWCYPNGKRQVDDYDDVPDFKHMNPCAISLVDGKVRKKFVECGVRNFEDTILKYLLDVKDH